MSQDRKEDNIRITYPWLPYAAAIGGILISILIWFIQFTHFSPLTDNTHSWIILGQGILLAILIGLAIRLIQVTQRSKKSFEIISENCKKEIADRIHAEETKQNLEKALLQGQKLQSIGTLAGGIAHDFNNILYAIIGYVELSRDDVAEDSLVYKNLGKVLDGCKRGQELISRILAFSRRQHHDFKPVCIKDTIEGVLGLLRPTIPASVAISLHSMTGNCAILGNQTQLHQVMVNLINNSVDAMDGEGSVIIEISQIPSTDHILKQFPEVVPGDYCKITITDTGHGMDQTTMQRIFEPFFTTKEVGKGTGLGLSTVHTIIKEHQGEIMVESQLGHGTTFTLLLPEYKDMKEKTNG